METDPEFPALEKIELPASSVDQSRAEYRADISQWFVNGEPYTGYLEDLFLDGSLHEKFGVYEGKKQNDFREYYSDGYPKLFASYHNNRLHGKKQKWSSEIGHPLTFESHYYLGKTNGEQKKWYKSGEIHKIQNFRKGKEHGLQRAFRKDGSMYANYEAENGIRVE